MKRSKYGAKKYGLRIDGVDHIFDSKLEGDRYLALHKREKDGEIMELHRQPKFLLQDKFRAGGKAIRAMHYIADFIYMEEGQVVVEDAKGMKTTDYKLKLKLFLNKYPEIVFIEVSRKGRGFEEVVYNDRN